MNVRCEENCVCACVCVCGVVCVCVCTYRGVSRVGLLSVTYSGWPRVDRCGDARTMLDGTLCM